MTSTVKFLFLVNPVNPVEIMRNLWVKEEFLDRMYKIYRIA